MTLKDRIAELKEKDLEIRKMKMELDAKTGEFNHLMQGACRELGLNETFGLVDVMDKALNHSEIKLA